MRGKNPAAMPRALPFGPDVLNGILVAWTFGLFILGPMLLFLLARGKLRIHGYWRIFGVMVRRGCIMANHPDGATPFLIPATFWPFFCIFPWCFPWNVIREDLLPPKWEGILRCVHVQRDKLREKAKAAWQVVSLLLRWSVVLFFPEGTRTPGLEDENRYVFNEDRTRKMRPMMAGAAVIARQSRAWIWPVWIDIQPPTTEKLGVKGTLRHLLRSPEGRMTIHWGKPFKLGETSDADTKQGREAINKEIQQAILAA